MTSFIYLYTLAMVGRSIPRQWQLLDIWLRKAQSSLP